MKKEYKELLLKDLCARLPYGVKCCITEEFPEWFKNLSATYSVLKHTFTLNIDTLLYSLKYDFNPKPYLRSMKDMTEDEAKEMFTVLYPKLNLIKVDIVEDRVRYYAISNGWIVIFFNRIYTTEQMDWLLEKHFDFRGLIDLDLAIRVTEENNPYKN